MVTTNNSGETLKRSYIIIFDAECNLCNASVNFIIKHDKKAVFFFTPIQSEQARVLMQQYDLDTEDLDTMILLKKGKSYLRAKAVIEIIKELPGAWALLRIFALLPDSFNDFVYRSTAKYRYKLFGKSQSCVIPSVEIGSRFLTDEL